MLQQEDLDDVAEQANLKIWMPAEYEAGHAARRNGVARSKAETICWRMGWQDADVSMKQDCGQITPGGAQVLGWSLYAVGQLAYRNGLPFAEDSAEVWKHGWIQMDIYLGVSGARTASELILLRDSD